ncbi:hypothetical protein STEG23_000601, partial [Scotinomys teguina]
FSLISLTTGVYKSKLLPVVGICVNVVHFTWIPLHHSKRKAWTNGDVCCHDGRKGSGNTA